MFINRDKAEQLFVVHDNLLTRDPTKAQEMRRLYGIEAQLSTARPKLLEAQKAIESLRAKGVLPDASQQRELIAGTNYPPPRPDSQALFPTPKPAPESMPTDKMLIVERMELSDKKGLEARKSLVKPPVLQSMEHSKSREGKHSSREPRQTLLQESKIVPGNKTETVNGKTGLIVHFEQPQMKGIEDSATMNLSKDARQHTNNEAVGSREVQQQETEEEHRRQLDSLEAEKTNVRRLIEARKRELETVRAIRSEQQGQQAQQKREKVPLEKFAEYEANMDDLEYVIAEKTRAVEETKAVLREGLSDKNQVLKLIKETQEAINNLDTQNSRLSKEVEALKAEHIERVYKTKDWFPANTFSDQNIRTLKAVGKELSPGVKLSRTEVRLTKELIPAAWLQTGDSEEILRYKFLSLRRKGVVLENEGIKLVLKAGGTAGVFVMRLVNTGPVEITGRVELEDKEEPFRSALKPTDFRIAAGGSEDMALTIARPVYDRLPRLKLRHSSQDSQSVVQHLSLPIAATWYHGQQRLSSAQFDQLWHRSGGEYLQTEIRWIDRNVIAGGTELLYLLEGLAACEGQREQVEAYYCGLQLPHALGALKLTLSAEGQLFIEAVAQQKDHHCLLALLNLYLFSLCQFLIK